MLCLFTFVPVMADDHPSSTQRANITQKYTPQKNLTRSEVRWAKSFELSSELTQKRCQKKITGNQGD